MNNKYRINVMDIILISLIACIVIVFGYTSLAGKSTVDFSQKQKFNILVFTDDILIKNADLFKVGDEITLSDTKEVLGTIKSIRLENTNYEIVNKATNTSTIYKLPDKKNATILIECNGNLVDESFFAGGKELIKGDSLPMHTSSISFSATIINVEEGK